MPYCPSLHIKTFQHVRQRHTFPASLRHHRAVTRDKIYKTVARQLHGVVPCWVCGEQVALADATLEHIKPRSEGGNSHVDNLAISHDACNNRCHARGLVPSSPTLK